MSVCVCAYRMHGKRAVEPSRKYRWTLESAMLPNAVDADYEPYCGSSFFEDQLAQAFIGGQTHHPLHARFSGTLVSL